MHAINYLLLKEKIKIKPLVMNIFIFAWPMEFLKNVILYSDREYLYKKAFQTKPTNKTLLKIYDLILPAGKENKLMFIITLLENSHYNFRENSLLCKTAKYNYINIINKLWILFTKDRICMPTKFILLLMKTAVMAGHFEVFKYFYLITKSFIDWIEIIRIIPLDNPILEKILIFGKSEFGHVHIRSWFNDAILSLNKNAGHLIYKHYGNILPLGNEIINSIYLSNKERLEYLWEIFTINHSDKVEFINYAIEMASNKKPHIKNILSKH